MIRLILDEHISPAVAEGLRHSGIDCIALQDQSTSARLGMSDSDLLAIARSEARTLVTYDRRTIEPLLREWGERRESHGGVILVDERTIHTGDIGALIRALAALVEQ